MSRRPLTEHEFSLREQDHVRNAMYFLRAKFGSWKDIGRVLHFEEQTLIGIANAHRNVTASLVIRMAKYIKIPVETLTAGGWPEPGTCPRCGYCMPLDGQFKNAKSTTLGWKKTRTGGAS